MMASSYRWDIFCAVVDNYGDAAIAWRLARTLAAEHGLSVRVFVDALATLARLAPQIDPTLEAQHAAGIEVRAWRGRDAAFGAVDPGAVVIEAFGCGLPQAYLEAMAARDRPPAWINLEYLSAEQWIEDCHGLASPQPAMPLTRYFFFPGFTPTSGGLLRERDLAARRDRFRGDPAARTDLLRALGVAATGDPEGWVVSLFCYDRAPVGGLLDSWSTDHAPILCLVPQGVADEPIDRWARSPMRAPGARTVRGRLTLARIPFVPQDDYDKLLWASDLNFVRGEDSFVRAQWAARPLVWQPYPQADDAHRLKLQAFLDRYDEGLSTEAAAALAELSHAWNGQGDLARAWARVAAARSALGAHAQRWASALARLPDLATNLVKFCLDRV